MAVAIVQGEVEATDRNFAKENHGCLPGKAGTFLKIAQLFIAIFFYSSSWILISKSTRMETMYLSLNITMTRRSQQPLTFT